MKRAGLIPADTRPEAARVQFAILRRLGPSGRASMAAELSENLRRALAAGVRHRHPEYSEEQVRLAVFRLTLGERLFREVFPECHVRP